MQEEKEFGEVFNEYVDKENLRVAEGSMGVSNLCQLVAGLGYKDPMRYGHLSNGGYLGDLTEFLEDNPGAIEAVHNWILENGSHVHDWKSNLESVLDDEEFEDE